MRAPLYALMMFLGVILTVHLKMNQIVGDAIGNLRVGNALFWCIGAIGAVAIGLTGWQSGALSGLSQVNPILLTAGLLGASLVFGIAWSFSHLGPGPATIVLIAGQILSAMVISHFGWLGSPVKPVTLTNAIGVVVLLTGVYFATRQ